MMGFVMDDREVEEKWQFCPRNPSFTISKVSKLVQGKLIPYRSIIGLGAFRKIKYFGDIPR